MNGNPLKLEIGITHERVALLTTKLSLLIAATTFGQPGNGGATDDNWSSGSNWNSNFVRSTLGLLTSTLQVRLAPRRILISIGSNQRTYI